MKFFYLLLPLFFLYACKAPDAIVPEIVHLELPVENITSEFRAVEHIRTISNTKIAVASRYVGYHQNTNRRELKSFLGIDPARIDWCAAFVNSVLSELGIPGSDTVSDWPLTARSFLRWGQRVREPQPGDIVIFPRGTESWQGHVGFYYGTEYKDGVKYYQILGGNQSNAVTVDLFPARSAIGIRRFKKKI